MSGLQIASGNGDGTLARVGDVSKGIRAELYGADGNPIAMSRNFAMGDQLGLPVMGQFLPGRRARFMRTDSIGSPRVMDPIPRFADPLEVNMTTTTGTLWLQSVTTMAATVVSGVKTLNSASTTTTTTGVMETSLARFDRRQGIIWRWRARMMAKWGTTAGQGTNGNIDFGFGTPASQTALAVTDGVFFRITTAGALSIVSALGVAEQTLVTLGTFSDGVITSNGTVTGFPSGNQIRVDSYYQWEITLCGDYAIAQIIDPETGAVLFDSVFFVARTSAGLIQSSHFGCFHRVANIGGAATTACQLLVVGGVQVECLDNDMGMTHADVLAGLQRAANNNPITQVQAANYANSAAPANATLSNTAAGYTTLGGQFQFAAVAGAETDYALFGFTPSGYRFRVRRVRIETWNQGAAVATTAHVLQWAMSCNGATINLATGTQFRETIGVQSFAVGAAVGALAAPVEWSGNRITEAGRLFIIILKMPIATATGSQVLRGTCQVDGEFE